MESELLFTLVYLVVSVCFILSPKEFQTAGLTVQGLFSSYLGSENRDFIRYHIKRTTVTVLVHCFFPLGKSSIITVFRVTIDHTTYHNQHQDQLIIIITQSPYWYHAASKRF